ncbi:hypothetical protein [Lentibacillus amyloliquefaciens]|uniref:hypothetical protein n=1 Tax=Lentibacillus amyloliquefaciens TaxID=1472767 RepID=UPI001F16C6CB|nr:hypothetical protein [Lentibacillus amyloliquefaciens]
MRDEGIHPSDRRLQKSYAALQAKALIEQRQVVDSEDILFLAHVLWENVDQQQQVTDIIRHHAQDPVSHTLEVILEEAQDIMNGSANGHSTENVLEATQKMKSLAQEITDLKTKYPERENELNAVHKELKQYLEELTNSVLEPIES